MLHCRVVNIDEWLPNDDEWDHALQLVQPLERNRIKKLHSRNVAKRTLVGRLLARYAIQSDLQIPNCKINLGRTPEGKPVLKNLKPPEQLEGSSGSPLLPTQRNGKPFEYAFNISHHGSWVACASLRAPPSVAAAERVVPLVGVDIVKYEFRRDFPTCEDFFESLRFEFTEEEWNFINAMPQDEELDEATAAASSTQKVAESDTDDFIRLQRMYRRWAVKEAYTKALGQGLDFGFQRVESIETSADSFRPQIRVDGEDSNAAWTLLSVALDRLHRVVVCHNFAKQELVHPPNRAVTNVRCSLLLNALGLPTGRAFPSTPLEKFRR